MVKYAGAAYLVWIGISMWRDNSSFETSTDSVRKPAFEVFKQSIFANMLNPKVAIFFLAFIPQFVNPESGSTSIQFLIYGIVFGIVGWIVFSFVAVASGAIGSLLKRSAFFRNGLRYLAGSVLIGLAIKIAFTK
ncbi:MAG: threonine/homoserine/homoserine lactone efflux protein [Limisphaerales bacterium]